MSQRLTDPALVTDEFEKVYWLFQSGQTVPFIGGAEGDDSSTDDTKTDDDTSGDDSDDDDSDEDGDDEDDDKDDKPDPAKLRERMKAADRRASKLEQERDTLLAEKKKAEDAKKGDLERAQDRVKELEAEAAAKDGQLKDLRVQVAFFSVGGKDMPEWIDPADALSSLDLSEVDIDEKTGSIDKKSLRKAIKTLAASKPHWVKKDDENGSSTVASGSQMNGKRKGDKSEPDAAALSKDFPALRTRQV